MTKKAVILELDNSYVTLFSEGGEFIRLPSRRLPHARYIGQSVSLDQIKPTCKLAWAPLLAACIFFLLVAIPLVTPTPVLAWVSLDGSSSLELLVDDGLKIKEIRALNNGARNFLEGCKEESLTFTALFAEFINWSFQHGDSSLLVTATEDIQKVKSCINEFDDNGMQVVVLEVDSKVRDEAGKLGLSAGRALFMAEVSNRGAISPEEIKEANPIDTLDSAGVNVEDFVSSMDPESQAEKIKDLPNPDQGLPEDDSEPEGEQPELDPDENPDSEEDQQGAQLPPGLAKKDINHPGVQSISRSGSWGQKSKVPKGPVSKDNQEWQEDNSQPPAPGDDVEDKDNKNKGKGKQKDKGKDKQKDKGNNNKGKDKQIDKGKGNKGKKGNSKSHKP
ncbi:MAG TPA: hypothetical protein DEA85_02180 [Firmicutes bacterium]|nr:hypothetical protein [Bacillota bacterium]